jgi:hypothetical protein
MYQFTRSILVIFASLLVILSTLPSNSVATDNKVKNKKDLDITLLISKEEFASYVDVADFIEKSPKVTIAVPVEEQDKRQYGANVVKTLTGTDCNRDGKMDDNPTCNAVYFKLWLKYER